MASAPRLRQRPSRRHRGARAPSGPVGRIPRVHRACGQPGPGERRPVEVHRLLKVAAPLHPHPVPAAELLILRAGAGGAARRGICRGQRLAERWAQPLLHERVRVDVPTPRRRAPPPPRSERGRKRLGMWQGGDARLPGVPRRAVADRPRARRARRAWRALAVTDGWAATKLI
eukprot:SAG11_NODE_750_length_7360_cov_7.329522_6_plen_173_part_00